METSLKETWIRILEYATSPKHGTLSRKLRKGVIVQINADAYEEGDLFLGSEFARVTETKDGKTVNTYYDWRLIGSIRTISTVDKGDKA